MELKLVDCADGVRGHFCIARRIAGTNFWEFYNKGAWQSSGQLFSSRESAEFKLAQLRGEPGQTTEQMCEALTRHVEALGCDVFYKSFIQNDKTIATVWCIVGPNAERFNDMVKMWLEREGFKLDQ